jgi:hypothetical protein
MAGSSPAKGIFGCVWIVGDNRFPSTGQPWAKPGHGALANASVSQPVAELVPAIHVFFGSGTGSAHRQHALDGAPGPLGDRRVDGDLVSHGF